MQSEQNPFIVSDKINFPYLHKDTDQDHEKGEEKAADDEPEPVGEENEGKIGRASCRERV